MNNLEKCLQEYSIEVSKIEYFPSFILLFGENHTYLLKQKDSSKKELFEYFESIQYPYYMPLINHYEDPYELYFYYEDVSSLKQDKGKEMVKAFSLLQKHSIFYEEFNSYDYQKIYESIQQKISSSKTYYQNLEESIISSFSFPRPDYYFFLQNSSLFYQVLDLSNAYLEEWYHFDEKRMRKSYCIYQTSFSNFRIGEHSYFIDYKDCRKDLLIYDFVKFYQYEYYHLDMISLFDIYQEIIPFSVSEKKLFFALLCIPDLLDFQSSIYENTVLIQKTLEYIHITFQFLSEEDKENQKSDEEKFEN